MIGYLTNALRTLIDEQLFPLDESVTPRSDLFAEGLDSMALMQLILLLEQEFAITIVPDDLNAGNFSTLEKMADFVSRKKA
jgi:acyl carrier protein